MREPAINPAMIRVVVIVLFVIISQVLRARKRSQPPTPPPLPSGGTVKASPLDAIREAMKQAADQSRARRGPGSMDTGSMDAAPQQLSQGLGQPSSIQPESSFIPSALLLALFACLCLLAYRYWAG